MIPNIAEIREQMEGNLISALNEAGADVKKLSLLPRILIITFASIFYALYRRQEEKLSGLFLKNVRDIEVMKDHLRINNLQQKLGDKAKGTLLLKSTGSTFLQRGTVFAFFTVVGSILEYETNKDEEITVGDNSIGVTALKNGSEYNLPINTLLSLQSPKPHLESQATVVTTIEGGVNEESTYEMRLRLLEKLRSVRTGGTIADYKLWASSVDGVQKAFVYPNYPFGGIVTIHFVLNAPEAMLPTDEAIANVREEINKYAPVGVATVVAAPPFIELFLEITITETELDYPLENVRTNIQLALQKYLLSNAGELSSIFISQLSETVSLVEGERSHILKVVGYTDSIQVPTKYVATLGGIVWK